MSERDLPSTVRLSQLLADANSIPAVRDTLGLILARCGIELDEVDRGYVLDALAEPVAFALSERAARGREYGDLSARQSIARRLGLGEIAQ